MAGGDTIVNQEQRPEAWGESGSKTACTTAAQAHTAFEPVRVVSVSRIVLIFPLVPARAMLVRQTAGTAAIRIGRQTVDPIDVTLIRS